MQNEDRAGRPGRQMRMGRFRRVVAVVAWVVVAACAAGWAMADRVHVVLRQEERRGFSVGARVDGDRAFVSWRPAAEYRPPWAGQVNRWRFRYTRWSDGSGEVGVPVWAIGAVASVAGTVACFPRRRSKAHQCPACGYDLTGNVSGVCPECGRPFAAGKRKRPE